MQAHELFRYFRLPELVDFRQYVRTLPTNTLMGFGAFAALTTFWYATRPRALKPPCDLAMQSVEVPGSDGARRSTLLDSDEPLVYFYEDVRTLYEGFQRGIQVSSKHRPESLPVSSCNFCRASRPAHRSHWLWSMVKALLKSHTVCFMESHTSISSIQALTFPA
ncbi:hypothetical protein FD754_014275 [Muntiacus muntjak]|uniref:Acyl-CoA synthetase long chain family member 1 n=1 Tax=Muntiacus muntjak TaxID=9888 RepID=A0A5N3VJY0_MUNMU|nr:hypothetical protein FD754_014275 [Muntiacus muntjak]